MGKLTGMIDKEESKKERSYPPVYEKLIPIAIGVLGFIIVGVLIFTVAVALGIFNFGA